MFVSLFKVIAVAIVALVVCSNGAPVAGTSNDLYVALRETSRESDRWHFCVFVHDQGDPPGKIKMATLYEACIVEGEFIQRARDHSVRKTEVAVNAPLLLNGKPDKQALREAVVSIIQAKSPNQPGCEAGWKNCFGWIMQGLGRLKEQGYLSQENYDKFLAYWNTHKERVKASTDGNSITLCGLDPNTTPGSDLTLRGLKNASACVKQKKKLAVAKKGTQPTGKGGPGKAPTKGPAQRRPKAHTQAKKAQPARSSKAPNGKKAK